MNVDLKNSLTYSSVLAAKAQANNTGSSAFDLQGYIGQVAVNVNIGTKTVGDSDGAISFRIVTSADTNVSNGTNYGTATVATTNNTTANGTIAVDVRDADRYLFAVPTVTGTNSPSYPVSVVAIGMKQVQP